MLVIIKDWGVHSMILIPGSLSFAKLVMMSSAPAKSVGDARYASQGPFIHGNQRWLSHTISTPICIRSAFFLRRTQLVRKIRQLSLVWINRKPPHKNVISTILSKLYSVLPATWPVILNRQWRCKEKLDIGHYWRFQLKILTKDLINQ